MPLTDSACRAAKTEGSAKKLSDGGGLYLYVAPSGSKVWRMNYRFAGKQKTLSFGPYPRVTLADARALRENAKRALADGVDPSAIKGKTATGAHDSFEAIAREWHAGQESSWVPAHAERVLSRFVRDVFPDLGERSVASIAAPEILEVLRKVEARGALDVTKRLRQSMGAVFRYAIATSRATRDPVADLRGALKAAPKVRHMGTLQAKDIGDFFKHLAKYPGDRQTALAIEFIMHSAVRTNELRFGQWAEIDGDLWRIPAERMKAGRDHLVPLTKQSKRLLAELKAIAGDSEWIVPGARGGKPISQNTMIFGVYRMALPRSMAGITIHGMRSTFSTTANESGLWSADSIEWALAHSIGNKVRSSYNHAAYLDERRRLMAWWSDYLTTKNPNDLSALLD
ncbi:integrase arm-type DNA-binding domain-containing protein [Mesorhizobium sp.]|uniref:tyrosine-type recombinase/integrase n=1 Tax=Mesorhizobium sp. TaxID=1871066 RepID=UPI00258082DB|nr:integrase arm-type DNA-binding domain-containing protein [Mesorhizobium sp.]